MRRLLVDVGIVAASIAVAVWFAQTDAIHLLVSFTAQSEVLASFVAGLFFTSMFTTAPAMVALGELAQHAPMWVVVGAGAIGATISDYLIFWFFSSQLKTHAASINSGRMRFIRKALRHSRLRFVMALLGALVIASPLPDELGLLLLGVSSANRWTVAAISFASNAFGIAVVCLAARALA